MNFETFVPLFALFSSVVLAAYSNNTFVPTTVTLTPTHSVETGVSTLTYADETTTFYITSTFYSTFWYTPISTSSVAAIVTDIPTTFETSDASYTSTITSTITSTLQVTQFETSIVSGENKDAKAPTTNTSDACIPTTEYVTVGSVTVTVTPEPVTKYITVTQGASDFQWNNGTNTA